jgi:hypothetical protein
MDSLPRIVQDGHPSSEFKDDFPCGSHSVMFILNWVPWDTEKLAREVGIRDSCTLAINNVGKKHIKPL